MRTIAMWLLVAGLPPSLLAQTPPPPQVLLYPGGAVVERSQRVASDAQELRFDCLAADIDADSLQVRASTGIAVGEIRLLPLTGSQREECRGNRSRELALQGQRDALLAEQAGLEMALGYMRNLADKDAKSAPALLATLDTLKRQTQEAQLRQAALRTQLAALDRELENAAAEAPPATMPLKAVLVRLSAGQAGDVRLSYRVQAAGWQPQYRAHLDTAAGTLRIERLAELAQTTGEDWRDARLRLSTDQPRRATAPHTLPPWRLRLQPPPTVLGPHDGVPAPVPMYAPAPAPAAAPAAPGTAATLPQPLRFDTSVFQGAFGAEYALAQPTTLRGNGRPLTVQLDSQQFPATVLSRLQPAVDGQIAWLVAELTRPAGSWPDGMVNLYRDGAYVGRGRLTLGSQARMDLFFGRDERLRLRVLPAQLDEASAGLLGGRRERLLVRRYEVENLHARALTVQVLEATPVAEHESIEVRSQLKPAATAVGWRDQPGIAVWQLPLAPQQVLKLEAEYRISVPKDARISGMP